MAIAKHTTSRALSAPRLYPGESLDPAGQFQIHVEEAIPFLSLTKGMTLFMDSTLTPEEGDIAVVAINRNVAARRAARRAHGEGVHQIDDTINKLIDAAQDRMPAHVRACCARSEERRVGKE